MPDTITTYLQLVEVATGVLLLIVSAIRFGNFSNNSFRMTYVSSVLIFVHFFMGAHNAIRLAIAFTAITLWYFWSPSRIMTPFKNLAIAFSGLMLLTIESIHADISPEKVITESSVSISGIYMIALWMKIIYEQRNLFPKDFSPNPLLKHDLKQRIDVILPCYNPREGWENTLIQKHDELSMAKSGQEIRFIVVNDGSSRGFNKHTVNKLTSAIPSTVIIDSQLNNGKGSAIRLGLAESDSSIALYTDYDFPYHTESICDVIEALEQGHDVVIGKRNKSYYSRLSLKRKLTSYGSQILNFMLLGLKHTDTQGGLKGFNRKGKHILASTVTNEFLFDTEFVYKASLDDGILVKNVNVNLRNEIHLNDMNSKVISTEIRNLLKIYQKNKHGQQF